MAAFRAELQKAHRRHDLALCLFIPGIVVLWVGGLAPADPEELANGYSALLYSLPVIEAILMPVMMAVLASRLWDMEIKGNTAKLLYTLQSRRSLFAGKAVFGVLEVLLVTVLELACVPVLGRVHGYTEAFPTGQLVYLFICTLAVDTMLFFGEFLLMLWVGNPLPALCVGIVGALVELYRSGKRRCDICREYDIATSLFDKWVKQASNSGSFHKKDNRTPEQEELIRLRKENQQLRMENDILKQAALILGRK